MKEKLLVLKVGTSTLVKKENDQFQLDRRSFDSIGKQITTAQRNGYGVILVSSAARKRLPQIGWDGVIDTWRSTVASDTEGYLLTDQELDSSDGCKHLITAARAGHLAIANADDDKLKENSRYASNDLVGATIALQAVRLGLAEIEYGMLSDIPGVLANVADTSSVIPYINDIEAHRHLAGGAGNSGATGGMVTKFEAAALTASIGIRTWIAHGRTDNVVELAMHDEVGTVFVHEQT